MRFHRRIDPACMYERLLVQQTIASIQDIFRLQKSWAYRQTASGGVVTSVMVSLFPKFVADNPTLLLISPQLQMELDHQVNQSGYRDKPEKTLWILKGLAAELKSSEKLLAELLETSLSEQYAEFLNQVFERCRGLCFSIHDFPYLLFQAVLETLPEMVRYDGTSSSEHYTETNVSHLMAALIDIQAGDTVYDGACGYGIQAALAVAGTGAIPCLRELSFQTAAIARFVMLMIGVPEAIVECGDTLYDLHCWEPTRTYDHFLTHPPVNIRMTEANEQKLLYRDQLFSRNVKNDQWLFLRQALGALKRNGTGAALVSTAVLNRDGLQYRQTRQEMIEQGYIQAVIELPMGVVGGAGKKFSILLCDRNAPKEGVYILDLSRKEVYISFTQGSSRDALDEAAIDQIAEWVSQRKEIEGLARRLRLDEIIANDYRLNMGAYMQVTEKQDAALRDGGRSLEHRHELKIAYQEADRELEKRLAAYAEYLDHRADAK